MEVQPVDTTIETAKKPVHTSSVVYSGFVFGSVAAVLFALIFFHSLVAAPKTFKVPSTVVFFENQTASDLIANLKTEGYITSPIAFKIFLKLSGRETRIPAGEYYFDLPLNASQLAYRFSSGDTRETSVRLTVPEGFTVAQVAALVESKFPEIQPDVFKKIGNDNEGYLFPDTYFFNTTATAVEIEGRMKANYVVKTEPLFKPLNLNEKQTYKILILASLLEEEGKTLEDKRMIAGILLNRLDKGMPLQVDATINYIKGVADRVYFSDLEIESPYNTYKNKGLPPGPISSPGLESLEAAISPTSSNYIYYLTGADGTFYYAKTFEEHVRNKEKYLR